MEILVASAVLIVLLLALLSMTNSTMLLTKLSQRRMDSSASLRTALDRMATDISSAILREDLPPLFLPSTAADGSDEMYLHSQMEGYDGDRGISLVGYRVRNGMLERGAQGSGWTTNALRFAESPSTSTLNAQNFDVIGGKVFRLKIEFIGTNGTLFTNSLTPTNWSQVRAVVINLASVDARAIQVAKGTPEELAQLLPGTATDPAEGILTDWQKTLKDPTFFAGDAQFPIETRRGIEVRRRIVPLAN